MDPTVRTQLIERLQDLFGLWVRGDFVPLEGGYLCENYLVETDRGSFFLKQYRYRTSSWIYEIKFAEQYFAEQGIPVILPLKDRFGRGAFYVGGWYSLFPFIEGRTPPYGNLSDATITSLGSMLGKMHLIGSALSERPFSPLTFWDRDRFHMEFVELQHAFSKFPADDEHVQRIRRVLDMKSRFVRENVAGPHHIPLKKDHFLHGDFIYQNTFIDANDQVEHVFDFERVRIGPRAYELGRSLFINCFDDGWEDRNIEQAKRFLRAYLETYPMPFEEFLLGIEMYYLDLIHSVSMEARYLLFGKDKHVKLFDSYANRIDNLHAADRDAFCRLLYKDAAPS